MSTGGEVANAQVCKTCIRGFESRPVLQMPQQDEMCLREGTAVLRSFGGQ